MSSPFLPIPSLRLALVAGLLSTSTWTLAAGDGLAALGQFLAKTQSGSASFTQTVAAPKSVAAAAQGPGRYKVSTGQFAFARPNRFRFDYQTPYQQTIVADGKTLWFYDHDLAQITASSQAAALQNTPATVITGARSVADLQKQFHLINLPVAQASPISTAAGLLWVEAKPKTTGGTIVSLKVGMEPSPAGVQLKVIEVLDSLGQRSVMEFSGLKAAAAPHRFRFTPPAGVTVMEQ